MKFEEISVISFLIFTPWGCPDDRKSSARYEVISR